MPFYEYKCRACGAEVEVLQKITDSPLKKCPECGKSQLSKLISAPVFRLKGGGWYETDFKTDQDKKRNLVESGGDEPKTETRADESTKAEAKPETKPETQPEAKPADKPAAKPAAKSATAKKKARARPKAKGGSRR